MRENSSAEKRSIKERIVSFFKRERGEIPKYVLAILLAIVWIIPFIGLFMASVRPLSEIVFEGWWNLRPFTLTIQNYVDALTFSTAPMTKVLLNTAIVAVPATVLSVILGTMTAYPFARFDFPVRKFIFFLLVLVMAAPPEIIGMTNYRTLSSMGLLDTYFGLIIIHVAWGLGWVVLFLRNYMLSIPPEMEEAARIDGASRWEIFKDIIFPISGPALVSVGVVQFTWIWNAVFFPLVIMRSPGKYLAPQVLPLHLGRLTQNWGRATAASILTMAVPIILFIVLQRYYKEGLTGSAIQK